jgi:transcriptional antiterminator RfaH
MDYEEYMHLHDKTHSPGERAWIVVNSHANQETIALDNLSRQGYDAYCPMIIRRRSHARRVEDVRRPLFSGYLFAGVNKSCERWRPILSTIGVRTLVHFGETLGTIREEFIDSLRRREKDGLITLPETPYRVGQQVRVAGGAFDGVVATILSLDERQRLVVLMDLMKSQVRVKLRSDQVMAL